ncbi:hypothetical protein PT974_11459 [Cladobotryum mycophilum]|uniref:FAM192A/Fyv6 N-terminal domain-containing protein n=1 Tax=Cladobotryum mycophilum TaxID=491253 RepID=A0ABR0S5A1_9HYPO
MAGRFVSGGTISSTGGETAKDEPTIEAREPLAKKNTEWEAVQQELEAERKKREEQRLSAATGQEQSLYEILQANKAAKQAAFEEQNRIKNQFRALDDDEIEFLDEVRAKERQEEERVKKETEQGLKAFRERRKIGGGAAEGDEPSNTPEKHDDADVGDEEWAVGGRKRKRVKEREVVKGVKRKTTEESAPAASPPKKEEAVKGKDANVVAVEKKNSNSSSQDKATPQ